MNRIVVEKTCLIFILAVSAFSFISWGILSVAALVFLNISPDYTIDLNLYNRFLVSSLLLIFSMTSLLTFFIDIVIIKALLRKTEFLNKNLSLLMSIVSVGLIIHIGNMIRQAYFTWSKLPLGKSLIIVLVQLLIFLGFLIQYHSPKFKKWK